MAEEFGWDGEDSELGSSWAETFSSTANASPVVEINDTGAYQVK